MLDTHLLGDPEGPLVILSFWWHVIFSARVRHFLSVSPHHLNGWVDDARIDVPGKRLLLFFIAYMLSFSFTIIFSVHTVWRAVYPSHRISFQVSRLLILAMTFLYFQKSKDVFVKIGNWTHWDSLLGSVTLSTWKMLQKLMHPKASFCMDTSWLTLSIRLLLYW